MKLKKPNFSPSAVCERAKARRAVLASVIDGPGPDGWKLEQVRLFIEEADGDETLEQVAERETYIWDGDYLLDADNNRWGYVDTWYGGFVAYAYGKPPSQRSVYNGSRDECQLALEQRFREAHQ